MQNCIGIASSRMYIYRLLWNSFIKYDNPEKMFHNLKFFHSTRFLFNAFIDRSLYGLKKKITTRVRHFTSRINPLYSSSLKCPLILRRLPLLAVIYSLTYCIPPSVGGGKFLHIFKINSFKIFIIRILP